MPLLKSQVRTTLHKHATFTPIEISPSQQGIQIASQVSSPDIKGASEKAIEKDFTPKKALIKSEAEYVFTLNNISSPDIFANSQDGESHEVEKSKKVIESDFTIKQKFLTERKNGNISKVDRFNTKYRTSSDFSEVDKKPFQKFYSYDHNNGTNNKDKYVPRSQGNEARHNLDGPAIDTTRVNAPKRPDVKNTQKISPTFDNKIPKSPLSKQCEKFNFANDSKKTALAKPTKNLKAKDSIETLNREKNINSKEVKREKSKKKMWKVERFLKDNQEQLQRKEDKLIKTQPKLDKLLTPESNSQHTSSSQSTFSQLSPKSQREIIKKRWKATETKASLPPEHCNDEDKLRWLQNERVTCGTYVYCDYCDKLRYLKDVHDPLELPDKWYCRDNPDDAYNNCGIPQQTFSPKQLLEMIDNEYNTGSIVWAKVSGFPWWPAIIDDDPDTEQFFWEELTSDKPTWYHATFFEENNVSRAWCHIKNIMKFEGNSPNKQAIPLRLQGSYNYGLNDARKAINMTHKQRVEKFTFLSRYKGTLGDLQKARDKKKKRKGKHLEIKIKRKKYDSEFYH